MSPIVSIIMGSTSDLPVMEKAAQLLNDLHVPFEMNALSAHRTPEAVEEFAKGADWLFHEAFCLYRDREIFSPYEKHHSTVKDACELAERLDARHLILWHTEDKTYPERAALYRAEGEAYYHGDLLVPEDGSVIEL